MPFRLPRARRNAPIEFAHEGIQDGIVLVDLEIAGASYSAFRSDRSAQRATTTNSESCCRSPPQGAAERLLPGGAS